MKTFKISALFGILTTASVALAAPKRIANCEAPKTNDSQLCVHVNDYGTKLKVILKSCGNMNSLETYTVVQNDIRLSGQDAKNRSIELQLGDDAKIIYAKVINLNVPAGFDEIRDLPLHCDKP